MCPLPLPKLFFLMDLGKLSSWIWSVYLKYSFVAARSNISAACPINSLFLEFALSALLFSPFSGSRFIPVHLFLLRCGLRFLVFRFWFSWLWLFGLLSPPGCLCHVVFGVCVSQPSFGFSEFALSFGIPTFPLICSRTAFRTTEFTLRTSCLICITYKCTYSHRQGNYAVNVMPFESQAHCRSVRALDIIA